MTRHKASTACRYSLLLAFSLLPVESAMASAASLPEHARFYSGNVEQMWADALTFMNTMRLCRDRFPKDCRPVVTKHVRDMDEVLASLSLITIFDTSRSSVDARLSNVSTMDEALSLTAALREKLESNLLEHDEDLLVRYGAVMNACPPHVETAARQNKALAMATSVDFRRYWQLTAENFAAQIEAMNAEIARYASEIRNEWSDERCTKTREFGRLLFGSLVARLEPYTRDDRQHYRRSERFGQGIEYLFSAALTFEAAVHPEEVAKIRDVER